MKLKKVLGFLLLFVVTVVLVGCKKDDKIKIGILQYLEHNALSEARKGFIDGLAEAGFVDGDNITIELNNPQGEQTVMDVQAKELVRKSDLIFAIATPAASAVVNEATEQGKDLPILFTAVTDPVSSKLIKSNEKPGANVTGTNDMNPIADQISLVKQLVPNATKLGIVYTASETNSELQANIAKEEAIKAGLVVTVATIESVNDLQQVANQLASKVDALYIPTDNKIAGSMGIINEVVKENGIPAIVGESNQVGVGGSITYGVSYYNLGKETAAMAVKILKDKISPKDIPSTGLSKYELVIDKKQLDSINITIPAELLAKADKVIE